MQHVSESGTAETLLDEIRQLFANDNQGEALDLLDAYLDVYPTDLEATLLKIELSLEADRNNTFIGKALTKLRSEHPTAERVQQVGVLVEARVRAQLKHGRHELSRRYRRDACTSFEKAMALAPDDPAVPLAAALALLSDEEAPLRLGDDDDVEFQLRLFQELLNDAKDKADNKEDTTIDDYLQRAIKIGPPEHPAAREAAQHLLRQRLANGRIDRALELLEESVEDQDPSLAAELAMRATYGALEQAAGFLRVGQIPVADELLSACADLMPEVPMVHIFQAEARNLSGDTAAAQAHYEHVVHLGSARSAGPALEKAAKIWKMAVAQQFTCPHCGKDTNPKSASCDFCERRVSAHKLLTDRYALKDAPFAVVAHIGLAEIIAAQGDIPSAVQHLDEALADLTSGHPAMRSLRTLRGQWMAKIASKSELEDPVATVWAAWEHDGLTPEVMAQVRYLCESIPTAWLNASPETRHALARALLDSGELALARIYISVAFTDTPTDSAVEKLTTDLTAAINLQVEALRADAHQSRDEGHPERALAQIEAALTLIPDHLDNLLLRADTLLALGNPLAALNLYRSILKHATESETGLAAQLGIARALETRNELGHALAALDNLEGPDADAIHARIMRRQRGEPVVVIRNLDDMVMHDTLERVPADPYHAAYFAVTVGAVRRPQDHSGWSEQILAASLEFTQILGGLRHQEGDPIFALRLISQPDPRIPERGVLNVAVLARVTAPNPDTCRSLARELWNTLRTILPMSHEFVYGFEPVVDEAKLTALLEPFEPTVLAEVVRREDVPQQGGDHYAVYPFLPASMDLHNLCWTLLRQPTPTMLSVHLLPTDVMPWETAALAHFLLDEPRLTSEEIGDLSTKDTAWAWWHGPRIWGQTQTSRRLVETLRAQAYILGITVMGGKGTSPLFPEMVAAALFGPFRDDGDVTRGGYDIVRAVQDAEIAAAQRNVTRLDVERWTYTSAPHGATRLRHLVGEGQAALAFRLPIPDSQGLPGLPSLDVKPIAPPSNLPVRGTRLGESVVRLNGLTLPITQALDDRRRHTYIVGKTGTGKSTLIKHMALQDIEEGHGVCVVDPHGDLVDDILNFIPAHRVNDVILFDPADEGRPIGLNLLQASSEAEKHRIVTEFLGLLVRMYDPTQQGIVGPRFQHNVRNAMLTAMALEGSTLIEVVRTITDIDYVREVLPHVTDPLVRSYWEKQIANTSDFHKSEILDYIVSKFSRFVGDQLVRNIIGQRQTTIDFRKIMDRRQILLVNLSKGKIGPENAQFLGLLLVQRLLLTALSRSDMPPDQRPDFFLYVDEFQNFATDLFGTVLSEGRKYGVAVTMANQYLTQLDHTIREAVFGNVGSIVSFRLGTQDAVALAPELYPVFDMDDLLNLPKFTTCVKLLVEGLASRPFSMKTILDSRAPNTDRAELIRTLSRQRYGRDVTTVTEDVLERIGTNI